MAAAAGAEGRAARSDPPRAVTSVRLTVLQVVRERVVRGPLSGLRSAGGQSVTKSPLRLDQQDESFQFRSRPTPPPQTRCLRARKGSSTSRTDRSGGPARATPPSLSTGSFVERCSLFEQSYLVSIHRAGTVFVGRSTAKSRKRAHPAGSPQWLGQGRKSPDRPDVETCRRFLLVLVARPNASAKQRPVPNGARRGRRVGAARCRAPPVSSVLPGRVRAEIREQGYAVGLGELDPDVLGVGAPVRGDSGVVVGALSVAAFSHRVPEREVPRCIRSVCEAAAELSVQVTRMGIG
ncbi:IclR family transcriptional regulator C-terminal domain-containing protein [Streptomyces sp. NPDC048438]|uniref:IclR family transcriptional regulator domain-containing protein n=1 Tax=Streptomyces sp. NPDC048438 TaxID=3365551 RepID=UPI003712362B